MSARGFLLSWQPSAGAPSQRHQLHLCHFIHVINVNQLPIYTLTSVFHAGGRIKPVNLNINPKSDNCLSETRPVCEATDEEHVKMTDGGWEQGDQERLWGEMRWRRRRQDEGKEQTLWKNGAGLKVWLRVRELSPPTPPRSTHNATTLTWCGQQASFCCCCPGCFTPQYVWGRFKKSRCGSAASQPADAIRLLWVFRRHSELCGVLGMFIVFLW